MSKQFKKFKKNDYYEEDDYFDKSDKNKLDKRKARRIKRAIQTRDISNFANDDEEYGNFYADDFER